MTQEAQMGMVKPDVYREAAAVMFNLPAEAEVTPLQRRQAKMLAFSLSWGAPAAELAQNGECALEEAQRLERYFRQRGLLTVGRVEP